MHDVHDHWVANSGTICVFAVAAFVAEAEPLVAGRIRGRGASHAAQVGALSELIKVQLRHCQSFADEGSACILPLIEGPAAEDPEGSLMAEVAAARRLTGTVTFEGPAGVGLSTIITSSSVRSIMVAFVRVPC